MSDSLDLAPPVTETVGSQAKVLTRHGRLVARYMVTRARMALEDHSKFDETLQNLATLMRKQKQNVTIAEHLKTQPFTVFNTETMSNDSYLLSWDEGEERFAITPASLD